MFPVNLKEKMQFLVDDRSKWHYPAPNFLNLGKNGCEKKAEEKKPRKKCPIKKKTERKNYP